MIVLSHSDPAEEEESNRGALRGGRGHGGRGGYMANVEGTKGLKQMMLH